MYRKELSLLWKSKLFPDLTLFPQRWTWLVNKVAVNWMNKEIQDPSLIAKLRTILNKRGC